MHRASLLLLTAILEAGTGVFLLLVPAIPLTLLLGVEQAAPETLFVARIFGAALLSLGVACWPAGRDSQSYTQQGLLIGVLIYDGSAAILLVYGGSILSMGGIALWPAAVLHTILAVWCVFCLWGNAANQSS